jgi:NAD-dependent SIR2 family protein deacetylase
MAEETIKKTDDTVEEEEPEKVGIPSKYFTFIPGGDIFTIRFDTIFDKPLLNIYNAFDMGAKRNFKLAAGRIQETYINILCDEKGELLPDAELVLLGLLKIQSDIIFTEDMKLDDFLKEIDTVFSYGSGALIKATSKYVDANYSLTLDETTKNMKAKHKNVNKQLIISDDSAKALLVAACLDRLLTPVVSEYFSKNKSYITNRAANAVPGTDPSKCLSVDDTNQKIFEHIFDLSTGDKATELKNKIYKMVYSRLRVTSFSGRKFWTKAQEYGVNVDTISNEIYSKIIVNSIPKLLFTKGLNVVNFLSAICSNQVLFLFSYNFREHYQPIDPTKSSDLLFESGDEDDSMSEIEKMEATMGRVDEGHLFIQKLTIEDTMKTIDQKLDVSVNVGEIATAMPYIHMNPIQEQIISLLTYKYFESNNSIKQLNASQYCHLIISVSKYLQAHKFVYLPKILLSKCIKQRDKTVLTVNKMKDKIDSSKRYRELIDKKYSKFKQPAENAIEMITSSIYNSSFVNVKGEDIMDNVAEIGPISEEIVDLCELI